MRTLAVRIGEIVARHASPGSAAGSQRSRTLNARGEPVQDGRVRLVPPENDHYAMGIWLRAIGQTDHAEAAFRAELSTPLRSPRYAPGDIECYLVEMLGQQDKWPDALHMSLQSYAARLPGDALGRAWSRISEARIRMMMAFSREDSQDDDNEATTWVEITPEHLAALDEIAGVLREAQSEAGGQSAEARSEAAMLWSQIMLVQVPAPFLRSWRWSDWSYQPNSGQIVNTEGQLVPLNYLVIGVSPSSGTT